MTAPDLTSTLPPGLRDPVRDSQALYRVLLEVLSRPGQPLSLPILPPAPSPLGASTGAILLALADLDAPVWLDPATRDDRTAAWIRFHSGAPVVDAPSQAIFAVIGDTAALGDLTSFAIGTPEYPDRSATLIVQVPGFTDGPAVTLHGPGLHGPIRLMVEGLPSVFWDAWDANGALFPQGVDVLFAGPDTVAGLPRTTRITREDQPCT